MSESLPEWVEREQERLTKEMRDSRSPRGLSMPMAAAPFRAPRPLTSPRVHLVSSPSQQIFQAFPIFSSKSRTDLATVPTSDPITSTGIDRVTTTQSSAPFLASTASPSFRPLSTPPSPPPALPDDHPPPRRTPLPPHATDAFGRPSPLPRSSRVLAISPSSPALHSSDNVTPDSASALPTAMSSLRHPQSARPASASSLSPAASSQPEPGSKALPTASPSLLRQPPPRAQSQGGGGSSCVLPAPAAADRPTDPTGSDESGNDESAVARPLDAAATPPATAAASSPRRLHQPAAAITIDSPSPVTPLPFTPPPASLPPVSPMQVLPGPEGPSGATPRSPCPRSVALIRRPPRSPLPAAAELAPGTVAAMARPSPMPKHSPPAPPALLTVRAGSPTAESSDDDAASPTPADVAAGSDGARSTSAGASSARRARPRSAIAQVATATAAVAAITSEYAALLAAVRTAERGPRHGSPGAASKPDAARAGAGQDERDRVEGAAVWRGCAPGFRHNFTPPNEAKSGHVTCCASFS